MTSSPSRESLLHDMRALEARGISCAACRGTCCTFVANSMRIDETEARIIARHLAASPEGLTGWKESLRDTVRRFALDRPEAGDGRRALSRRRYTCTFFQDPGCALPFAVKPLGCLAFNPRVPAQTDGGDCGTAGVRAEDAETATLPIPLAVLNLLTT